MLIHLFNKDMNWKDTLDASAKASYFSTLFYTYNRKMNLHVKKQLEPETESQLIKLLLLAITSILEIIDY